MIILQAKLDDLPDAFHQCIQVLGLGMAAAQGRDASDVKAIFVPLDYNRELAPNSHEAILA